MSGHGKFFENKFIYDAVVGVSLFETLADAGLGKHTFELIESQPGSFDGTKMLDTVTNNTATIKLETAWNSDTIEILPTEVGTTDWLFTLADGKKHRWETGHKVTLSTTGTAPTDVGDLYVISIDENRLALSITKAGAITNQRVKLIAGTGIHTLTSSNVISQRFGSGTVKPKSGSTIIDGTDTVFKTTFKQFSKIYLQSGTTNTDYMKSYTVKEVYSDTRLEVYTSVADGDGATDMKYSYMTEICPKPDGYNLHRPYDGGVEITAGTSPDSQIIRQTRRYFRYQSGKGQQCSMAVNFSPTRTLSTLIANGTTATGTTQKPHSMVIGDIINITLASVSSGTNYYNGQFTVTSVPNAYSFTYTMTGTPSQTKSGGFPEVSRDSWTGSVVRCGMYDDQNGLFYEYDGQNLYAVRRSSIQQIPGTISVTQNSGLVNGLDTSFSTQLSVGQYIVIRGPSHTIVSINAENVMEITPRYKGKTATDIKATLTEDYRVPQSSWNMDKCDGTGRNKYKLDIHKIQMIYIDYSWYGAGTIRYGFKGHDGSVIYSHRTLHNNKLTEAYFRSGNLPGRYEVLNSSNPSTSPTLMHWGCSVIMDGKFDDDKAYLFTASSTEFVFSVGNQSSFNTSSSSFFSKQYLSEYNGYRFVYGFPALASGVSNVNTGINIYDSSGTPNTYLPDGTNVNSLWTVGSTTYVFTTYPATQQFPQSSQYPTIPSGTTMTTGEAIAIDLSFTRPLVTVRLAPSADTGLTGPLGEREIINRMMLNLKNAAVSSTHNIEVRLLLNAELSNRKWQRAPAPSLSELVYHELGDTVTGGVLMVATKISAGSAEVALGEILEMSNSILGGDGIFPNGPDSLTLTAKIIDPSSVTGNLPWQVSGKISWAESQA